MRLYMAEREAFFQKKLCFSAFAEAIMDVKGHKIKLGDASFFGGPIFQNFPSFCIFIWKIDPPKLAYFSI